MKNFTLIDFVWRPTVLFQSQVEEIIFSLKLHDNNPHYGREKLRIHFTSKLITYFINFIILGFSKFI